jgi:hypothetical protein
MLGRCFLDFLRVRNRLVAGLPFPPFLTRIAWIGLSRNRLIKGRVGDEDGQPAPAGTASPRDAAPPLGGYVTSHDAAMAWGFSRLSRAR